LGVEISEMKNDLEDTSESLSEDKKFAADLEKNCAGKTSIHEEEKKVRAEEVVALADTIKILNDDDALELFKKTLPSASASFLQVQRTSFAVRSQASSILMQAQARGGKHMDFVLLALRGRQIGFDGIIKLVDELVATLKNEQANDESKKTYCETEFDTKDDKKKGLEQSLDDLKTAIEVAKDGIATLAEEIAALKSGISALDKMVAEATEMRKAEHAAHKELISSNSAAKEVLLFAKNRLNKFYNPKLYKPDPALVQSVEDVAPAPPPKTAAAYKKKSQGSTGIIAMMDLLVQDLDKAMTESETEEKDAQADYEASTADAADKRRQDSKSLTDQEAAKADMTASLERSEEDKHSTAKELMATLKNIQSLHQECDWLLKYFSVRRQARSDEIDSLEKAKAVLKGADFSLLQRAVRSRTLLLRHA